MHTTHPAAAPARSIHTMLRQSYIQIIAGMALPLLLVTGLLLGLTQQYNSVIADTSSASVLSRTLEEELPDQIWQVISGRISYAQGTHEQLLQDVHTRLQQMQARSDGEQSRYLNAALRAAETIQTYHNQLHLQLQRHTAVSVNENLYREIRSVAQLAATMIDRYVASEISRMGQINTNIQQLMLAAIILLTGLVMFAVRTALHASRLAERSIRESILRLEHMAARIAQGDLDARVPPASVEELASLTHDLNDLAGQISRLLHERTLQAQTAKKAELRALQAQITPHFVYNTLETVVWLAEEERNREVVEITMAFTDFLRISLSSGHDFITVAREEQHVYSYLMIQSVRYGSIMQYEIDIDPALAEFRMLKLMLQPLVENAIYHGIKSRRGRGHIRVTGRRTGSRMEFCVEDNGLGMPPDKLSALRASITAPDAAGGYGLRNVEQRLRLYYDSGLSIESTYQQGTKVSFCLPCTPTEGEPI